jgi:hypothetical protein
MGYVRFRKGRSPACRLLGILACLCAVTAITAAATPAPASAASPRLDATLTGTVTGGFGLCCSSTVFFEGSSVVMGVGAVEFTGSFASGCLNPLIFIPTPCFRRLDLLLVSPSGATLAIHGDNQWLLGEPPPQVLTWSVDANRSTGRFADFEASGAFTFSSSSSDGSVVIALSGVRQPASH